MKDKKNLILTILTIIMILAIVLIIIFSPKPESTSIQIDDVTQDTPTISSNNSSTSIVKVEKEITSKIIEDGLKNMGVLLCEKYYFTEVISFSSAKELFNIQIPFTESEFLASYDGVVTAGIDFNKIEVQKDDINKIINIKVPASEIQNIDIDTKSFKLYSEKSGLGNSISIEDYNISLVQLEDTAKSKAIEKGVLERSDENATKMINSFVSGFVDTSLYKIEITN